MMSIQDNLKDGVEKEEGIGGTADDFEQQLATNTSAFESLERDFQEVLTELMGDHVRAKQKKQCEALTKKRLREKMIN